LDVLEDLFLFDYLPKILLAVFCGSLIGLERELKEKPAGMRTYMLICTGATLFTIIGIHFTENWEGISDPMRVAAQVVTGIGFLGAGTILFGKGHVSGLTSAAAIWMSAAIGMAIGIGLLVFSVVVTLIVIISLMLLGRVEFSLGLKGRKRYILTVSTSLNSLESIQQLIKKAGSRCNIVEIMGTGDKMAVKLECEFSRTEKARFNRALTKVSGDIEIKIE
jgi:putative Mg2+ transporter-C (MgtC) family protein